MSLSIITAIAKNGVIGKNSRLPWDIPEDLDHFYRLIDGKSVIVGYNTYNSMGDCIKGAAHITLLSRNHSSKVSNCTVSDSIRGLLNKYQDDPDEVMVIGGASVYRQFLPFVNKMYLTLVDHHINGDVFFPAWRKEEWSITKKRSSQAGGYRYDFLVLERSNRTG